jgi:biopolymer transport protein ExbB
MNYISLIIQENLTGEELPEAVAEGVAKLDFIDLAMEGGWIMVPIILLSFVAIAIFITKYFEINVAGRPADGFMNNIKELVENDDISGAMSLCRNNEHPISNMIHKGLTHMGRPMSEIKETLENIGNQEIFILEKGLSSVAMVASAAPMIGFLGTVLGMIEAFFQMSNAGSNIDISLLSGGIYTAMVTTVAGLIVGLIGYFAYNILTAKIKKVVYNMESVTGDFMDILIKPIK